ncbi:MAG: PAAR domain-containing protein [Oscillospiraceae bacterium]|nr:PAAR domain-containing protein [Oscillospiraceae bacterium]
MTAGEHSGHPIPHGPLPITGFISGNVSANVYINALAAATIGSITTEYDGCCGTSRGAVGEGSSTVFINGRPAARIGDAVNVHNGAGEVTDGSQNVYIGG